MSVKVKVYKMIAKVYKLTSLRVTSHLVYKQHIQRKSYEIVKQNSQVISLEFLIRHIYEKFLSYDSSDRLYVYARIYDFSYVRKFRE